MLGMLQHQYEIDTLLLRQFLPCPLYHNLKFTAKLPR